MVETRMPDPSGAPIDPAVTPSEATSAAAPQYSSRREMRAAEAAARGRRGAAPQASVVQKPATQVPAIPTPAASAAPLVLSSLFPAAPAAAVPVVAGPVAPGPAAAVPATSAPIVAAPAVAAPVVFSVAPSVLAAVTAAEAAPAEVPTSTAVLPIISALAEPAAVVVTTPFSDAQAHAAAEAQASAEKPTPRPHTAAPVTTGAAFSVGGEAGIESVSVTMPAAADETAAVASKTPGVSGRLRGIRGSLRSGSARSGFARPPRGPKVAAFSATGPATADAARTRKNPFSVLVTMLAVTGLFAVAALPAYGLTIDPVAQDAVAATAAVKDTIVPVQSLSVGVEAAPTATVRDGFTATTREQLDAISKSSAMAATCSAYYASGSTNIGDDYPWPCELSDDEGGGLSPLNYFYRECVDFVAWRLNRDAGSYTAPFKFVWSNLTPSGGNASQWRYAWESHGWATSSTPAVGWVAWFNGNHVAYVSAVNADGTVLIEEYNHGSNHRYGQRTIPATDVALFLSPPPR